MNGGVCIDGVDSFQCSCPPNMSGRLCECLVVSENELDCNFSLPITTALYTSTGAAEQYTTESVAVSSESTATDSNNVPKLTTLPAEGDFRTTTRSRLSTSFQAPGFTDTQTFRASTSDNELLHGTFSYTDATALYTDESALDNSSTLPTALYTTSKGDLNDETSTNPTRFASRPTPGYGLSFVTEEPTAAVPTDAPEHITHFFTEFPRLTTSTVEFVETTTTFLTTTTLDGEEKQRTSTLYSTTDHIEEFTTITPTLPSKVITFEPYPQEHTTEFFDGTSPTSGTFLSTKTSIGITTTTSASTLSNDTPPSPTIGPYSTTSTTNTTTDCKQQPCENNGTCTVSESGTSSRVSKINLA